MAAYKASDDILFYYSTHLTFVANSKEDQTLLLSLAGVNCIMY